MIIVYHPSFNLQPKSIPLEKISINRTFKTLSKKFPSSSLIFKSLKPTWITLRNTQNPIFLVASNPNSPVTPSRNISKNALKESSAKGKYFRSKLKIEIVNEILNGVKQASKEENVWYRLEILVEKDILVGEIMQNVSF